MAVAQGYGKTVTSGSVFAYDVADARNCYIGQPGTNITTGANRNYNGYSLTTYSPGAFFETNGYTETVNIPALGTVNVQSIEINNSASGNVCCPNLFSYTGGFNSNIWTPGQAYTYQIIFKTRSGYTHPNFMYHYQYTSGASYITEYGLLDTNKMESLGDGWFHAWNTFTVGGTAVKGYTGLWYYNYNVADKVSIAAIAITPGSTIRPPKQIIPSGTTRSATQGLLPLVGNSTIDLSNVSFDSNAQMTFDGTDDLLSIVANAATDYSQAFTLETVFKVDANATWDNGYRSNIFGVAGSYSGMYGLFKYNNTDVGIQVRDATSTAYAVATGLSKGIYYHLVGTWNGTNELAIYLNGELAQATSTTKTGATDGPNLYIGGVRAYGGAAGNAYQGEIPIAKYYNRALSAGEVRQNYLHYKTRFNLS